MKRQVRHKRYKRVSQTRAVALRLYRFYVFGFAATFIMFFTYLYLVSASIYYTSVFKDSQVKISAINSEISELEADFVRKYDSVANSDFNNSFVSLHESLKQFAKTEKYLGRAD